ncbi:hypothetical protein XM38_014200 [Halomicronema hongdechloris C2206]|uniref:Uncharacterized protein n=1 Tax=Halomicronema hongdechloris C2206 TaxID=1641165 RepID=A0A1Z3HJK3_9CYAN|nr:hypothetical protein [Halomicronema hongdechloris]ASC70481.1 hypothetical protein XM38_014200 [Halomicronema hongdechloris C2206]
MNHGSEYSPADRERRLYWDRHQVLGHYWLDLATGAILPVAAALAEMVYLLVWVSTDFLGGVPPLVALGWAVVQGDGAIILVFTAYFVLLAVQVASEFLTLRRFQSVQRTPSR